MPSILAQFALLTLHLEVSWVYYFTQKRLFIKELGISLVCFNFIIIMN
jgi:hypothetical protein